MYKIYTLEYTMSMKTNPYLGTFFGATSLKVVDL
jgi:hypothetical protein